MSSLAAIAFLAAAAGPSSSLRPLALGDEGWLQCYEPNDKAKTCRSIATYWKNDDGTWDNIAVIQLTTPRPLTLETVTKVREENGAVCGTIRLGDIMHSKLRRAAGSLLPSMEAEAVLREIAQELAPLIDKKICTNYEPAPAGLIAKATLEGGRTAFPDQRVKWVEGTEGYKVAAGAPL